MLGQKIGSYRITRLIGKGGMGLVYEAVHEEIERQAAIKVLLPEFTNNAEATSRFLNEARAVNIVSHPSLVNIYEFGRLTEGNGSAYIIMEYLAGETLRARLERLQQPLGMDGLRIIRQIASALAAAHAKRIVHRDLKPANVMLIEDPDIVGGERVKVLDFGIAKLTEHSRPTQVETRVGTVLGSPAYMSPEQCRNTVRVDDRSDVYSLGAILYEMFAGRPPFVAESDNEIMGMQMYIAPEPLHKLAPAAPPELDTLVMRMLDKTPANRPGMREVITNLDRIGGFASTESRTALPALRLSDPALKGLSLAEPNTPAPTLNSATGEGPLGPPQRPQKLRAMALAGGGGVAILLGLVLIIRAASSSGKHPPEPAASADTERVHFVLKSEPPGAQVWNTAEDRFLGVTPYAFDAPRGDQVERLRLRLPGYNETEVLLEHKANAERMVSLSPESSAAPAEAKPSADAKLPADRKGGKPKGLGKKKGIKIIN
jgi:serine/threonine-protein kinase